MYINAQNKSKWYKPWCNYVYSRVTQRDKVVHIYIHVHLYMCLCVVGQSATESLM